MLDAGFNLDFIDADAINDVGIPYKVLILPDVDRIPIATYEKILEFARRGGIVISTRRMPATAPGFLRAAAESSQIQLLSREIFQGKISSGHFVADEKQLGSVLARLLPPDVTLSPTTPEVGFIHRKLADGDLYFVANTSAEPKKVKAHFRAAGRNAEAWDAFTGKVTRLPASQEIPLDFAPYESRLLFFSDHAVEAPFALSGRDSVLADLSRQWKITFGESGPVLTMDRLESWAASAETQFFSGHATYEKAFELNLPLRSDARYSLDLGSATAEALPSPPGQNNMRAYLDAPVRDAAEVFVNGERAGVVWHPPYRIDVTAHLHPGTNELRVVVGNTAINGLAGQSLPDYRLLSNRYGLRFVPQGMENLRPLPSGLLGPVKLIVSTPE